MSPPCCLGGDSRGEDDGPAEELVGVLQGLASVHADANADRLVGVGVVVGRVEGALDADRAEQRLARAAKGEQEAVAAEAPPRSRRARRAALARWSLCSADHLARPVIVAEAFGHRR